MYYFMTTLCHYSASSHSLETLDVFGWVRIDDNFLSVNLVHVKKGFTDRVKNEVVKRNVNASPRHRQFLVKVAPRQRTKNGSFYDHEESIAYQR
jgi:hypothetical protein